MKDEKEQSWVSSFCLHPSAFGGEMPGFIGHTAANTVALVGTSAYMWYDRWSIPDILAVDAGILIATFILSPDMDLFKSEPMAGWGVLRIFWLRYAKLVRHRDRLHIPVLGTAVRWLYLSFWIGLLVILFRFWFRRIGLQVEFDFQGDTDDMIYNLLFLVDVFVGAIIADTMHYVLDIITSKLKIGRPRRERWSTIRNRESSFAGEEEWKEN
jgi:uncharacterized metal-binding protein